MSTRVESCSNCERLQAASDAAVRQRDALRDALRKLMKESAAILALAEPSLRDALGHTNVAVFTQRIKEAADLLAAPPQEEGQ